MADKKAMDGIKTNEKTMNPREKYIKTFTKQIEEISDLDKKSCNVFKIMGCTNDELKHSHFLKWLLYNNAFFKRFVQRCGIDLDGKEENTRRINKEETYKVDVLSEEIPIAKGSYDENDTYRHIDLNIIGGAKDDAYTITIENKVDSGEHDDQCISYYNYMMDPKGKYNGINDKNKFFVFLAKNIPPQFEENGGIKPKKDENGNYIFDKNKEYKETSNKLKFFNYRLITYKDIKEILDDKKFQKEFKKEFVENTGDNINFMMEILSQYSKVIDEWNKLPDEYCNVFSRLTEDQNEDFAKMIADYEKRTFDDEKNTDFGRFLEVAYEYHQLVKEKIDKIIKPILSDLIRSDKIALKTDYGRGGYAATIPVKLSGLGIGDLMNYVEELSKNNYIKNTDITDINDVNSLYAQYKQEKNKKTKEKNKKTKENNKNDIIDKIRNINIEIPNEQGQKSTYLIKNVMDMQEDKVKKIGEMFNSVDFRAPMDGNKNITIGIYAGMKKTYSESLWTHLCKQSELSFGNEVTAECKILNGSGQGTVTMIKIASERISKIINYITGYIENDPEVSEITPEKVSEALWLGNISFSKFISKEYVEYLCDLKEKEVLIKDLTEDNVETIINCLYDYFIKKNSKSNIMKKFKGFMDTDISKDPDGDDNIVFSKFISANYVNYLLDDENLSTDVAQGIIKSLYSYFMDNETLAIDDAYSPKKIDNTKSEMLKDTKIRCEVQMNKFLKSLNDKCLLKEGKEYDKDAILTKLVLTEIENRCKEQMDDFFEALKNRKLSWQKKYAKDTILKKLILIELTKIMPKENIEKLAESVLSEITSKKEKENLQKLNNDEEGGKENAIKSAIEKLFDALGNKAVNQQWVLAIDYEVKTDISIFDEEDDDSEEKKTALRTDFYENTLKGVSILGYEEYFTNIIFKPKDELKLIR